MNFGTMKLHVKRNLGNRKDIDTLVAEWINSAYLDLITIGKFPETGKFAPVPIPELDGTDIIQTGIGGTDYPLPINCLFPISVRDTTNNKPLSYKGIRWYDRNRATVNGKPERYAVFSGRIFVDPPSDETYNIQIRSRKKITVPELTNDAQAPIVDEIWHEGIEICATYRGARSLQLPTADVWYRDLKNFVIAHSEQTTEEEANATLGFRITL